MKDYDSFEVYFYLKSSSKNLLEHIQSLLLKGNNTQTTEIFWALLKFSDDRVNCLQHEFTEEYTVSENTHLYTSVLDIKSMKDCKEFDFKKMHNKLSKSSVFFDVQDLKEYTTRMVDFLWVDFSKEHLVQYPEIQSILMLM